MRWLIPRLLAPIALAFCVSTSASAASAIYRSAPENVYGWCAGYPQAQANRCAQQQCRRHGGSACRFVVGCVGPGAVAYPEPPADGFAAACLGNERSARTAAMIGCLSANGTLCRTAVTFTSDGRSLSADADRRFDRVWTAQVALQLLSFLKEAADGSVDAATTSAVAAFQTAIGRAPTGVIDDELLGRMLDAVGGARHVAAIVEREQLPSLERQLLGAEPAHLFHAARAALPAQSPGQYFRSLGEDAQKVALTAYVMSRGAPCTLPSRAVSELAEGIWAVVCQEATYNVVFNDRRSLITGGGRTIVK